jgi:hypothetical protein
VAGVPITPPHFSPPNKLSILLFPLLETEDVFIDVVGEVIFYLFESLDKFFDLELNSL